MPGSVEAMASSSNGRATPDELPVAKAVDAGVASSVKEVSSGKTKRGRKRRVSKSPSSSSDGERPSKEQKSVLPAEDTQPPLPAEEIQPPLPAEPTPPPLPDEEPPSQEPEDDGWEPVWDATHHAFYFYNRFTQATQWENPRVPTDQIQPTNHDRIAAAGHTHSASTTTDTTELHPAVASGYNPAIHGSYDPNAAYAQFANETDPVADPTSGIPGVPSGPDAEGYDAAAHFNRFTGRFQASTLQPSNFNDESKSKRQMNAFFDVDAAANSHDGRSLKAERQGKKLTKSEVKQFRERKRERKEEKRRAWLRD